MCLIVALAILIASYNFYEHAYMTQALMSASLGLLLLGFFTYKIIKNGRCVFGTDKDCNKRHDTK
jgi:hypothetical protein